MTEISFKKFEMKKILKNYIPLNVSNIPICQQIYAKKYTQKGVNINSK